MIQEIETYCLDKKTDSRGWLIEVFRGDRLKLTAQGQVYLTTANPGFSKANHYHERKTEYFCIIQGQGLLALKDLQTGIRQDFVLTGEEPQVVKIPPRIAHTLKNTGNEPLYILAYIDECYSPHDPDTFPYNVLEDLKGE